MMEVHANVMAPDADANPDADAAEALSEATTPPSASTETSATGESQHEDVSVVNFSAFQRLGLSFQSLSSGGALVYVCYLNP